MSWLEKLYQTYENCTDSIGNPSDQEPLLPICHSTQNAHIEIVIDNLGRFRRARVLTKDENKTVIPCTEGSGGRAGSKPTSHPLCDKLQYVAADFLKFGGDVTSGFAKKPTEPHETYLALLSGWCASDYKHPKIEAVLTYVKNGSVIADLCAAGILPADNERKKLLKEWDGPQPEIFRVMPAGALPEDAFVRWAVETPGDPQSHLWQDKSVWRSWSQYYLGTKSSPGLCYVTGVIVPLATQHPAKLRNAADKAKLISANDGSGFTFRGRFTDTDGSQASGVSYDVTQKAHNALRWLIARQGRRDGTQAVVAWAVSGAKIPELSSDTSRLFDDEVCIENKNTNTPSLQSPHAEVAQAFALRLKNKIGGYRTQLGDAADIIVLALDSATPGRMALTYYRELAASDFLARIEAWHSQCSWHQNFGKNHRFTGAPALRDIAEAAYGPRTDDKLISATYRRILPCIVDGLPLPRDLVENCVRRASNRIGLEPWAWEKTLGIACALYRKQTITDNERNYHMALETNRTSRDYLYGRLLALAERLEGDALRLADENRDTNAARLMQRFSERPFETWRTIELALAPYKARLRSRRPGTLKFLESEIDTVSSMFEPGDFTSPNKLSGEFLLSYHCQRAARWAGPDTEIEANDTPLDETNNNN